jgi:hypothetical protein
MIYKPPMKAISLVTPEQNANTKFIIMKAAIVILLVFFGVLSTMAQSVGDSIQFKGGTKALHISIINYLSKHNGVYNSGPAYSLRDGNKYFILVMKMDSGGSIDKGISILSLQDTTNSKVILDAIKQTDGNWVNQSHMNKTIILPVYYLFMDDKKEIEKAPFLASYFYSPSAKDIICLEPFVIKMYPEVR